MENRFGIKDFFLFLLLIALLIVIVFAMKQYDRQYQLVRDIEQQGRDQLRELVAIHTALDRGVAFATTQSSGGNGPDAFPKLRALRDQGKYNQGDWFVQNLDAAVGKVTPLIGNDLYAVILQSRVMECMAYQDVDTLDWVPLLATGWQISPDGLTITFQLRRNVTFSDGSPLTADDVVFSYDWIMNPKVDAPRDRQALEKVASVTKTSDFEVVFKFKDPFFQSFANSATLNIMSKAFYSKFTPEQFNQSVGLLIGTGPYRLQSPTDWKPNPGKIELIRNERYWGLQPSFDRLVFYQIESDATNLVMYTNGELDEVGLQPQQYKLLMDKPDVVGRSQHFEYPSPLSGYGYIGWNQKRNGKPTIFADKRVRQAMTMLTNRAGICKDIYLGYATPAAGPFSPLSKQHDPSLQDWQYDFDRAKSLLREVGWEDRDGSGVLKLPDGTPFTFKVTYGSKNETLQRTMQYVKDSYARAGVNMVLDPADWTIMDARMKQRDFDAMCAGWAAGAMEDDLYQIFDSSQIADQGDNYVQAADPDLDAAIRGARTAVDEAKRMELWHQCERILHDDQPYTFLVNRKALRFFDKRIQNIQPARTGLNFVQSWVEPVPWYVPTEMQKYK